MGCAIECDIARGEKYEGKFLNRAGKVHNFLSAAYYKRLSSMPPKLNILLKDADN